MKKRLTEQSWLMPLAIALMVGLVGWWGNTRLRQTLEAELASDLNDALDADVTALEIWTTNQIRIATALAEEPAVRTLAARILDTPGASGVDSRLVYESDEFGNYLRPRLARFGYQIGQLVSTNFIVVAHSGRSRVGIGIPVSEAHTNKFAQLFASGEPVVISPFKPELPIQRRFRRGEPGGGTNAPPFRAGNRPNFAMSRSRRGDVTLMQVAAPIRNDGNVLGALALIIDPDKEFTRILSVARSGETGETYVFDQTGLLISRSRFDDQLRKLGLLEATNASSALNLRLYDPGGDLTQGFRAAEKEAGNRALIHLATEAISGEDGVSVAPTRDYRGVLVVGAWRWLPQLELGIATQLDAREAYHPLHVLQWLFVILFLMLLLCATGLFVFSHASHAWRRRLNEAELRLKQLGQYTLEEKIGEGGMGIVYRARHALMRRETAVKLLLPGRADAAAIERFEREVCLTCQLTHPNTVQVYDYGHTPEGIFYYAMEFLRGVNLHQLVTAHGTQLEGRVIYILAQVCDSLAEAHGLGLVHRDIKPANVFLCYRGGVPDCVKVLDFGLVREYNRKAGKTAAPENLGFAGTPSFMAPETFRNPSLSDPRSDIYAIGVLAYFLLTGSYAFDGNTTEEIYQRQMDTELVPAGQRTSNPVSDEFEGILAACLDKNPDQRPQSVQVLRDLLMSSPRAADWTPEAAVLWWTTYEKTVQTGSAAGGPPASSIPSMEIDIESRVD